jgi:predicted porin
MKLKWVMAAALAATGSSAYSQSSVTLYGVVDAGLLYQSTSAASFSPAAKNLGNVYRFKDGGIYSSLWGMKGTEDIGGSTRTMA